VMGRHRAEDMHLNLVIRVQCTLEGSRPIVVCDGLRMQRCTVQSMHNMLKGVHQCMGDLTMALEVEEILHLKVDISLDVLGQGFKALTVSLLHICC
jgi:hypothetical protein